jgi:hypothetical protein
MRKAVVLLAVTYVVYWCAWFALLVMSFLFLRRGTTSDAERGVALAVLGTLALVVVGAILATVMIWKTAPAGAKRIVTLLVFLGLMAGTFVIQGVSTLLVFNR